MECDRDIVGALRMALRRGQSTMTRAMRARKLPTKKGASGAWKCVPKYEYLDKGLWHPGCR